MKNTILLFALLFVTNSFCQKIFRDDQFNFSIQEPKDWIRAEKSESLENLKNTLKLSDEQIDELLENNKGTIEIVTFYKYPLNSVSGVIPTIKINLRKNTAKSFDSFKRMMENSILNLRKTFPNITMTKELSVKKIDGKDCIYFESVNKIPTKIGEEEFRTITYAVPVGNSFYQINFIDRKNDNCEKLFDEVLNSIHL